MKIKQSLALALGPLFFGLLIFLVYGSLIYHDTDEGGLLKALDWRINDSLLILSPRIPEDPHLVMLDIDDNSVLEKGLWPWPRDAIADLIMQFKANGAGWITFDIEYIDPGVSGVNVEGKDALIGKMQEGLIQIQDAVTKSIITPEEAQAYTGETLKDGINSIIRDNDKYLGNAVKLFGKAFVTVNVELAVMDNKVAMDARSNALEHMAYPNIQGDPEAIAKVDPDFLRATIVDVAGNASGAGFTNMQPDSDGVTRRVYLLRSVNGKVFPQLAFRPLLDYWGNPAVEVFKDHLLIKRSGVADEKLRAQDLRVPLDPDGKLLINWIPGTNNSKDDPSWLPGKYSGNFKHVLAYELFKQRRYEKEIAGYMKYLGDNGYLGLFWGGGDFSTLAGEAETAYAEALAGGDKDKFSIWLSQREDFLAKTGEFLASGFEKDVAAYFDQAMVDLGENEDSKKGLQDTRTDFESTMKELKKSWSDHQKITTELKAKIEGCFAIIGNTATSTTDLGVTPYIADYENPGVHSNVANTLLQGRFLSEALWWMSPLVMLGSLIFVFLIEWRIKRTGVAIIAGFSTLAIVVGSLVALYLVTGYYIGVLQPALAILLSLIYIVVFKFYMTDKEKRFIRGAFASYLSPDVIKQIEKDPSKLVLGGEKRQMTAMFTDVKGFSTFSEKLDPNDLVKLLNVYLTGMAGIIREKQGTIDKYEGDAIIAFWGAPTDQPDHAQRAVHSAILQKRLEAASNPEWVASGLALSPLLTRIGINSGDMTVGNMGSAYSMNYTAMGNAMNLAARLEGVNKQYGTWILTSEFTRSQVPEGVLFRGLDRVTVVGISTPVRLFEVVDFAADAKPEIVDAVAVFEEGIRFYETRQWAKAVRAFNQVLTVIPEDGPSLTFIERCKASARNPPPENWDGVFRVTQK